VSAGDIQDLTMPFCAVSTNLLDGSEVRMETGDIIEAIRASISIPGVFTPVKRNGQLLVDGGLVNPVPISAARLMGADFVVAVDLNHGAAGLGAGTASTDETAPEAATEVEEAESARTSASEHLKTQLAAVGEKLSSHRVPGLDHAKKWFEHESTPNILEVVISSLTIMEMQITEMRLASHPPDLLLRPALGHVRPTEFHRGAEMISEGRRVTEEALRGLDQRVLG
jgi:NTE family protein